MGGAGGGAPGDEKQKVRRGGMVEARRGLEVRHGPAGNVVPSGTVKSFQWF